MYKGPSESEIIMIIWHRRTDESLLSQQPSSDSLRLFSIGVNVMTKYTFEFRNSSLEFEVDKNKKIVWTYKGYRVHEFQVLSTNGKKLKGNPLK